MVDHSYLVNGVSLDDPAGRWNVLRASVFRNALAADVPVISIAGGYGEQAPYYPKVNMTAATLPITLMVSGANYGEVRANHQLLLLLLRNCTVLGQVTDDVAFEQPAYFMTASEPETWFPGLRFVAMFRLPEVDWRQAADDWVSVAPSASTMNWDVTTLAGSTGPIRDAIYLFTGPCQDPTVTDASTGFWFKAQATLAGGEKMRVDSRNHSAVRGASATLANAVGTDATATLRFGGQRPSEFLHLNPLLNGGADNTTVQIAFSCTGYSAATRLSIRARKAHS